MVNLQDYLVKEVVKVTRTYYKRSNEVDRYLKHKIQRYLKNKEYDYIETEDMFVAYVYNDMEDWAAIRETYLEYNPKDHNELERIMYSLNSEGMNDAESLLEDFVYSDIENHCLSSEEVDYVCDIDGINAFIKEYGLFEARYNFKEIWNKLTGN